MPGQAASLAGAADSAGKGDVRMALVDKLYDWLNRGPTPGCDHALAAALAHAEPLYFDRIVQGLLKRAHPASWAGLIGHYGCLPPETRRALLGDEELMQTGIATTARSGSADMRCNALAALQDCLNPRMVYLVADALRDRSHKVRKSAAQVLRATAGAFLDRPPPPQNEDDPTAAAEYQAEREQLIRALRDALRTFDLHSRIEVAEAALWFADDLNLLLWETLGNPRSRCGYIVSEHLESWSSPRLAAFLLLGLIRVEWRPRTSALLRRWSAPAEVIALLRNSHLLAEPGIRRGLSGVKPAWPGQLDAWMSVIPIELRARVPEWVCHLGYDEDEKVRLLSKWLFSSSPDMHRAAVYALAALGSPEAIAKLKSVATSDLPLAPFARWYLVGRQSGLAGASRSGAEAGLSAKQRATVSTAPARRDAPEFTKLWQVCRRTVPRIDRAAVQSLREHLDVWRPQLTAYLQSSDPRDRMLVLWLLSTDERVRHFLRELQMLVNDPVAGIRQAAQAVLQLLPPGTVPVQGTARPHAELLSSQQALLEILQDALAGKLEKPRAEGIAELTRLLQLIHLPPEGAASGVCQVVEGIR